jgi:hypothetical protein
MLPGQVGMVPAPIDEEKFPPEMDLISDKGIVLVDVGDRKKGEPAFAFQVANGFHHEPSKMIRREDQGFNRKGEPLYVAGKSKRWWKGQVFLSIFDLKAHFDKDNRSPPKFNRVDAAGNVDYVPGAALNRLPGESVTDFQKRVTEEAQRSFYSGMTDAEINGFAADNEVDLTGCADKADKIERIRKHQEAGNVAALKAQPKKK